MKKSTMRIIVIVVGICFTILLYLQLSYLEEILEMRREQFTESVNRSINRVIYTIELDETQRGLLNDAKKYLKTEEKTTPEDTAVSKKASDKQFKSHLYPPIINDSTLSGPQLRMMPGMKIPKFSKDITHQGPITTIGTTKEMQDIIKKRYVYQQRKLDDVIFFLLSESGKKPINERVDFRVLDGRLKYELESNGVKLPYHFQILTREGRELYRCSDYDAKGSEHSFTRILFPNDPPENMTVIKLHFPDMGKYIFSSVRFIIPALILSIILLATYIFTMILVFRQRKYTEMKNDLINNMTHEFKTPISTISLAAQMLADPAVAKSGKMFEQLSGVINDETKRLRFQVEKVLQISLFERNKARYNKREINLNNLIADVAHTYTIKVKNVGGTLTTDLSAKNATVFADEMHMTNVVFNLLDNALKYRRENVELQLNISTRNEGSHIIMCIADNGIGIRREDLHKIFGRFYRVHTGDRHDVKGFGLGLAYVKSIVDVHEGNIHAESEFGQGTKFIISLPIIKKQN